jgi:hypothetical protein
MSQAFSIYAVLMISDVDTSTGHLQSFESKVSHCLGTYAPRVARRKSNLSFKGLEKDLFSMLLSDNCQQIKIVLNRYIGPATPSEHLLVLITCLKKLMYVLYNICLGSERHRDAVLSRPEVCKGMIKALVSRSGFSDQRLF